MEGAAPGEHQLILAVWPCISTFQEMPNREQTCGCQGGEGVGEGWIRSLGLADANFT